MDNHEQNKKLMAVSKVRLLITVCVLAAALCAVIFMLSNGKIVSAGGMEVIFEDGKIKKGVTINGVDVGGLSPNEAKQKINEEVEKYKQEVLTLAIEHEGFKAVFTAEQLGLEADVDKALTQAMLIGRGGSIIERQKALSAAFAVNIELGFKYDLALLDSNITNEIKKLNILAKEPEPKIENGKITFSEGVSGLDIDIDNLLNLIKTEVINGTLNNVKIPGSIINPHRTKEEYEANIGLIGRFTTSYNYSDSGRSEDRIHNLEMMCSILTKRTVEPGEIFSINQTTGPRNNPNIWKPAHAISGGYYKKVLAGGVCQVATTLYNAVLLADLKVVQRVPHSIPSGYCDLGYDATLAYNSKDFQFQNNTDWPVFINLYVDRDKMTVNCEIFGKLREDGLTVELKKPVILERRPSKAPVTYTMDPSKVKPAHDYIKVETCKLFKDAKGKIVKQEKLPNTTYPGNAAILLGPDPSASPEPTEPTASPTPEGSQEPAESPDPGE